MSALHDNTPETHLQQMFDSTMLLGIKISAWKKVMTEHSVLQILISQGNIIQPKHINYL